MYGLVSLHLLCLSKQFLCVAMYGYHVLASDNSHVHFLIWAGCGSKEQLSRLKNQYPTFYFTGCFHVHVLSCTYRSRIRKFAHILVEDWQLFESDVKSLYHFHNNWQFPLLSSVRDWKFGSLFHSGTFGHFFWFSDSGLAKIVTFEVKISIFYGIITEFS